jgi:hypothetical protein
MIRYLLFLMFSTIPIQGFIQISKYIENYTWDDYKNFVFKQDLNYGWALPALEHAGQLLLEPYMLTKITNKKVCAFIREQLGRAGVEEPERISIMRGISSDTHYSANFNSIAMSNANYKELKDLLRTMRSLMRDPQIDAEQIASVQAKLDIHVALIHHEAGHLKYHDNFNILVVLAATGAAFDWLWNKIAPTLGADAYMRGRESYTDASYIKLCGLSCTRRLLCELVKCAYSQLVEWRADGNIAQDVNTLKGAQKFFTWVHTGIKKSWAVLSIDLDKYPYLTYAVDPYHPRASRRAESCAERIAALERVQAA